ncbi:MAG: ATP-binding protein [Thermodesulfobacteriota bacterium]|nr:ATP-binding protein [Thermodesulfobacteriota bacterium]
MDESNWVSVVFSRNFTKESIKSTKDSQLPYKSGQISLTKEGMGSLLFYLLKYTFSTASLFRTISSQTKNFSKIMAMTIVEEKKGYIHIKYHAGGLDLLDKNEKDALCEHLDNIYRCAVGYIESVPTIHGQKRAIVKYFTEPDENGIPELHLQVTYAGKKPIYKAGGILFSATVLFVVFGLPWPHTSVAMVVSELILKITLLGTLSLFLLLLFLIKNFLRLKHLQHEAQKTINKMDSQYRDLQRTKETLKEQEQLLRKVAENYPNSYVSIIEKDLTIRFTSGLEYKKRNINPDRFVGLRLADIFSDQADILTHHVRKTFDGEECVFEHTINNNHFLHRSVPLYSGNGAIHSILAVTENITERKQFETSLKESEEKYRSIMESMKADVYICSPDFHIEYMNTAFIQRLGHDATGGKCHESLYGLDEKCPWCMHENVMKGENREAELTIPDNGRIYHVSDSPIFHTDGTISKLSILQDITAHRNLERNYRTLFREMLDGFALHETIWNEQGEPIDFRYLAVNPAFERMIGIKEKDVVGRTTLEILSDAETDLIQTLGSVVLNGDPVFFGYHASTSDRYFQVTAFQPESGQLACIFADITDIKRANDEKQRLESQLQHSRKMEAIGTLAGGIAHDFNNILFPIIGYTEMMLGEAPEGSEPRENLNEILNCSLRARDLVQQILVFSRQTEKEIKPVKIQLIVSEVIKLIRATLPATIEIKQHIDKNAGMVLANPTHIHQIVMNLTTNAYHAMENRGGTLTVELSPVHLSLADINGFDLNPGTFICLSVSDTGHGIEKHNLERLFEPYFTTKDEGKGTGLGLSVVHGIVKAYKGDIRVFSEPGIGSTFKVYLPAIKAEVKEVPCQNQRPLEGGSEHILLVDDEAPILKMEKQMLEHLGYQVTSRTSSIEALAAFRALPEKFDLVITDMTMPNMTGDRLAFEIKKIRAELPVIVCTGFSRKISPEKAKMLGIDVLLMKPIVRHELVKAIQSALNKIHPE